MCYIDVYIIYVYLFGGCGGWGGVCFDVAIGDDHFLFFGRLF